MTLSEFLQSPAGRRYNQSQWARKCGVSRGYFSQLAAGKKPPSLALALLIEDFTEGKVTCHDWGVHKKVGAELADTDQ